MLWFQHWFVYPMGFLPVFLRSFTIYTSLISVILCTRKHIMFSPYSMTTPPPATLFMAIHSCLPNYLLQCYKLGGRGMHMLLLQWVKWFVSLSSWETWNPDLQLDKRGKCFLQVCRTQSHFYPSLRARLWTILCAHAGEHGGIRCSLTPLSWLPTSQSTPFAESLHLLTCACVQGTGKAWASPLSTLASAHCARHRIGAGYRPTRARGELGGTLWLGCTVVRCILQFSASVQRMNPIQTRPLSICLPSV